MTGKQQGKGTNGLVVPAGDEHPTQAASNASTHKRQRASSPTVIHAAKSGGMARGQLMTYNGCTACRDSESDIRLSHALNSTGTVELAPLNFCDGQAPTCSRCRLGGRACRYNVDVLEATEERDLRYQLGCRNQDFSQLLFLLRVLHHGTDEEASLTLARIRLGEDVGSIIALLKKSAEDSVDK